MIACEFHESGHCLAIVKSEIVSNDGEIVRLEEHYECLFQDLSGVYEFDRGDETVEGSIVATDEMPRTIADGKRRGAP